MRRQLDEFRDVRRVFCRQYGIQDQLQRLHSNFMDDAIDQWARAPDRVDNGEQDLAIVDDQRGAIQSCIACRRFAVTFRKCLRSSRRRLPAFRSDPRGTGFCLNARPFWLRALHRQRCSIAHSTGPHGRPLTGNRPRSPRGPESMELSKSEHRSPSEPPACRPQPEGAPSIPELRRADAAGPAARAKGSFGGNSAASSLDS